MVSKQIISLVNQNQVMDDSIDYNQKVLRLSLKVNGNCDSKSLEMESWANLQEALQWGGPEQQ